MKGLCTTPSALPPHTPKKNKAKVERRTRLRGRVPLKTKRDALFGKDVK